MSDAPTPPPSSKNPLARPVRPHAVQAVEELGAKFHTRCGGRRHLEAAAERVSSVDADLVENETHVDDGACERAADATARAVIATERVRQEHADASASDRSLDRAQALLVEALGLIECVGSVGYHAKRIARAREDAADAAARAAVDPDKVH